MKSYFTLFQESDVINYELLLYTLIKYNFFHMGLFSLYLRNGISESEDVEGIGLNRLKVYLFMMNIEQNNKNHSSCL